MSASAPTPQRVPSKFLTADQAAEQRRILGIVLESERAK